MQFCQKSLRKKSSNILLAILWCISQFKVFLLVIVKHIFGVTDLSQLIQINSLWFFYLLLVFILYLLLSIGDDPFAIDADRIITTVDFLFQTIVKASFPNIDHLIRPSRDKIVALPAKLGRIWVRLKSVLKSSLLAVPYLGRSVLRWADQIRTVRMKINTFDWSLMPLVDLNHMLRPKIVKLDLFIMRTRGNTVTQWMKLDLMDNSSMFLVSLYRFFSV